MNYDEKNTLLQSLISRHGVCHEHTSRYWGSRTTSSRSADVKRNLWRALHPNTSLYVSDVAAMTGSVVCVCRNVRHAARVREMLLEMFGEDTTLRDDTRVGREGTTVYLITSRKSPSILKTFPGNTQVVVL